MKREAAALKRKCDNFNENGIFMNNPSKKSNIIDYNGFYWHKKL